MPKVANLKLHRSMIEFDCEEELTAEIKIGRQLFEYIIEDDFGNAVLLLIEHKRAGLEYLDKYANTPLLMACYLGRKDFVQYLLKIGANYKRINLFGQNALTMATYSGDKITCELLLEKWTYKDFNKSSIVTPMCTAVLTGNIELVEFYMKNDIVSSDRNKCTTATIHGLCPLKLAIYEGLTAIQDLLYPKHCFHLDNQ